MAVDDPVERAAMHRALFEQVSDAVLVIEPSGHVVLANAAAERLLGYAAGALVGKEVEALVPSRFVQHKRQREGYSGHARPRPMGLGLALFARHADGRELPVDIALSPLTIDGATLVSCALRDLRGRAHGNDVLRVQATALRSAANGVVITDRTGTITWVNPAACAITGYASDELVGRHTRVLKSGEHPPEFYASIWETVTRGETWSGTIVNRRKDGSRYHEEQTIAPVVGDDGLVTHFIAIKQDVSAQHRTQEALATAMSDLAARVAEVEILNRQLRELSIRDALTGLYNRRYLGEMVARDVARITRDGAPLALALLDLDLFKQVNDTHGHAVGDQVLVRMAELLRTNIRASDVAFRHGGEEFLVVLPGAALRVALERAERWRAAFAASPVPGAEGVPFTSTVSIGVAVHRHGKESFEETVARADEALYQAKLRGRNRVISAEADPEGR